jgi:hypothetical protein
VNDDVVGGGEADFTELGTAQQQSCECHVCTAPLMTPVSIVFEISMSLMH